MPVRDSRVAVVGGGAAGAAVAIALGRLGLRVIVLEARSGPTDKVGECLPPSVNPILERLGLRDRMDRDGHIRSHGNRSVWGTPVPVEHDFLFGTDGPGWHLDRRVFEASLAASAREAGIDWRAGCRVERCRREGLGWQLILRSSAGATSLDADFIVDATGRPARLARALGARKVNDDRLVGAVASLSTGLEGRACRDTLTLVEAMPGGWWYSAALPGGKLAVALMTDGDLNVLHAARDLSGWLALLASTDLTARRARDGDYRCEAPPRIVAAQSTRLVPAAGAGWIAVGDAAAAYDPLSSFGIGSALGTGYYAALAVVESLSGRRDAMQQYTRLVETTYFQYLDRLRGHYSEERRWPDEPFWRRRHEPGRPARG